MENPIATDTKLTTDYGWGFCTNECAQEKGRQIFIISSIGSSVLQPQDLHSTKYIPVASIGIFEDSWDTGDSPLSKCGVEPVLPQLLPLALISSCIAFSHQFVSNVIAPLVVCWLGNL
jgi:hypothetical protein